MRTTLVALFTCFSVAACSSSTSTPAQTPGVDSGGGGGGTAVNGCTNYTDLTAATADRTIDWTFVVSPNCLKIAKGQTVTWKGSFTTHPLASLGGDANNPIDGVTIAGDKSSGTVTFNDAGTFGFHCQVHAQMKGAILVQ